MSSDFSQRNLLFSVSQQGEVQQNSRVTLLSSQSSTSRLITLAKEYGSLLLGRQPDGLRMKLGPHYFTIRPTTVRSTIVMEDVMDLSASLAMLLIKVADIFFPHRREPFKIQTSNPDSEFMMWLKAKETEIRLDPYDDRQAQRFQKWEQESRIAAQRRSSLFKPERPKKTDGRHPSLVNGTIKLPHHVALYLDYGAVSPLADLILEHGDLSMILENGLIQVRIHEMHLTIAVEYDRVTFNILDLDLTRPGAAELLGKILDIYYYDLNRRMILYAPNAEELRALYRGIRQFGSTLVEAANPQQSDLLTGFAKERGIQIY